jgi:D-alanyl-D-alanine carboxypeptidase
VAASGRPIGELITEPLGLRGMYWPAEGETTIRGTHPRGYLPADPPVDITESDQSPAWSAGALVGRPSDVNRFLAGLLGGRLLAPAQLAEMKKTVAAPGFDSVGGSQYDLGLATFALTRNPTYEAWIAPTAVHRLVQQPPAARRTRTRPAG